jgi:hypothetical protein
MWLPPASNVDGIAGIVDVCLALPQDQLREASEAVAMWDKALHQWNRIVAHRGANPPCDITVREVTTPNRTPGALAWVNGIGGNQVSMYKGHYEQDTKGILLHELGHAFGAQHVPGTLMHPEWSPGSFVCPDHTTVAQVAARYQIDLSILTWCW